MIKLIKINFFLWLTTLNFQFKEVHDREDSVSHSKLHTEAAGKREGNLHLLSHTHHQLPAAGRRTLLQHILPQASVQRNKIP